MRLAIDFDLRTRNRHQETCQPLANEHVSRVVLRPSAIDLPPREGDSCSGRKPLISVGEFFRKISSNQSNLIKNVEDYAIRGEQARLGVNIHRQQRSKPSDVVLPKYPFDFRQISLIEI